jgi:hypothetical protein
VSLLIKKSAAKIALLPIQKSVAKNFVVADSKISSKTALQSIQKSIAKNCVATDLEIGSDCGVILDLLLFFLVFT